MDPVQSASSSTCFLGQIVTCATSYAGSAELLTTAGEEVDDLDHDLWTIQPVKRYETTVVGRASGNYPGCYIPDTRKWIKQNTARVVAMQWRLCSCPHSKTSDIF